MINILVHGNELLTTIKTIQEPIYMDKLINLLDVIIWPVAFVASLILFKKNIGKLLNSLGTLKVGAQGVEINFIDEKIQEASKMIGIGPSGITAKDGGGIIPKSGHADTPYQELIEMHEDIHAKIKGLATERNIDTSNTSIFTLVEKLVENNAMVRQTSSKLKSLLELTNVGLHTPTITQSQVNQIRALFNNLSF